ncbi:exosome nuclease subunit [Lecanora helva]
MATDSFVGNLKETTLSALINTTRTTGQISNEDLAFHQTSDSSIVPLLEGQRSRLLRLLGNLINSATSGTETTAPQLFGKDSVEDNWGGFVDVFDNLLEKADACLDEYSGTVRRLSRTEADQIKIAASKVEERRLGNAYRSQNIPKPQVLFDILPNNNVLTPFKPLLTFKPHSITPLDQSLVLVDSSNGLHKYKHPYESEIKQYRYPAETYEKAEPVLYMPFESTRASFVDTPEALLSMLDELKGVREVAVDLEHHDEHSYAGLVSLMQISTRNKDWIIDALKPWRQQLQILNEVFANPAVLKVFHGAYMDIIWLQRDFGLYVVGLFDTFHASRSLGYPRNSLAYLLKRFANFDAAKQYQMADWRIRPLPEEMFNYARSDTHFLLYIYDNMRNELLYKSKDVTTDRDLIGMVLDHSKQESLQSYERPLYDTQYGTGSMGWYNLLCRTPTLFNREQFAVFRAVHQWRDSIARTEDESLHAIMSKQVLYNIAREMPTNMPSLLGCTHPMSKFCQKRKGDLLLVVKQGKAEGATGPEMKEVFSFVKPTENESINDYRNDNPGNGISSHASLLLRSNARNTSSEFWGPLVPNEMLRASNAQPYNENPDLVIPLPRLTLDFGQDSQKEKGRNAPTGVGVNSRDKEKMEDNDLTRGALIFNEIGSLKERSSLAREDYSQPNFANLSGSDTFERKPSEKAKKKTDKRSVTNDEGHSLVPEEFKAFDYARAPSVLNPQRDSKATYEGGRRVEKPYSKSLNAPKSMRKTKGEGAKSGTFKG